MTQRDLVSLLRGRYGRRPRISRCWRGRPSATRPDGHPRSRGGDRHQQHEQVVRPWTLFAAPGNAGLAPDLARPMAAFTAARTASARFWPGRNRRPAAGPAEKAAQARLDATLNTMQDTISNRLPATADQAHAAAGRARAELLWAIAIGVAIAGTVIAVLTRHTLLRGARASPARRRPGRHHPAQRIRGPAAAGPGDGRAETSVFDLVSEALGDAAPDVRSELLLADSSKAHFRQVLVSSAQADESGAGWSLPTTARRPGRGTWSSPTARPSTPARTSGAALLGLCVPVSIGGNSVGVFHVTADGRSPPSDEMEKNVEVVVRRASERLAMLRAFQVSESEANSDSLTGLMTRRSLEIGPGPARQRPVVLGGLRRPRPLQTDQRRVRPRRRRPGPADVLPGAPRLAPAGRYRLSLRRRGVRHRPSASPATSAAGAGASPGTPRRRSSWPTFPRSRSASVWRRRTRPPTSRRCCPGRRGSPPGQSGRPGPDRRHQRGLACRRRPGDRQGPGGPEHPSVTATPSTPSKEPQHR